MIQSVLKYISKLLFEETEIIYANMSRILTLVNWTTLEFVNFVMLSLITVFKCSIPFGWNTQLPSTFHKKFVFIPQVSHLPLTGLCRIRCCYCIYHGTLHSAPHTTIAHCISIVSSLISSSKTSITSVLHTWSNKHGSYSKTNLRKEQINVLFSSYHFSGLYTFSSMNIHFFCKLEKDKCCTCCYWLWRSLLKCTWEHFRRIQNFLSFRTEMVQWLLNPSEETIIQNFSMSFSN